jgi:probable rRNA maturation factor
MKITTTNLQKRTINQKLFKKQARQILAHEKVVAAAELSLVFVDDPIIKKLNRQFLARKVPTDVLAFDLSPARSPSPKKHFSGEIIISTDTARRNARIFQTSFQYEMTLYMAHGILHLLGFDDTTARKAGCMRRQEARLLDFLGMRVKG